MQAGSAADVPEPPKAVDAYFVDNEDDFSAGVGKRGGEMPTEGALFWEETDKAKIKSLVLPQPQAPVGDALRRRRDPQRAGVLVPGRFDRGQRQPQDDGAHGHRLNGPPRRPVDVARGTHAARGRASGR